LLTRGKEEGRGTERDGRGGATVPLYSRATRAKEREREEGGRKSKGIGRFPCKGERSIGTISLLYLTSASGTKKGGESPFYEPPEAPVSPSHSCHRIGDERERRRPNMPRDLQPLLILSRKGKGGKKKERGGRVDDPSPP